MTAVKFLSVCFFNATDYKNLVAVFESSGAIKDAIEQFNHNEAAVKIYDIPLYHELGAAALIGREPEDIICVTCDGQSQLQRAMHRSNLTVSKVQAILSRQLPQETKMALSTIIIDNSGTLEQLQQRIDSYIQTRNIGNETP